MKATWFVLFAVLGWGLSAQTPSLIPTVLVEGGTFPQGLRTLDPPNPGRAVTVSSFLMGETVVTQGQYLKVTGKNPARYPDALSPVEKVSWFDAVAFCNQLSLAEGLSPAYLINGTTVTWDPAAPGWRLPTEAEYEWAARGGKLSKGYDFPGSNAAEKVAWGFFNSHGQTHQVKTLPPNELGIDGLAGNVWQWCWDWYAFDRSNLPSTDPRGPATGSDRVSRGGAWNEDHLDAFRPYYRADDSPETTGDNLGFRVVRNAPAKTE